MEPRARQNADSPTSATDRPPAHAPPRAHTTRVVASAPRSARKTVPLGRWSHGASNDDKRSMNHTALVTKLSLAALGLVHACQRSAPTPVAALDSGSPDLNEANASAKLAPLRGQWIEPIGEDLGVVAIPLGATERRPVLVSLHGAAGAAEWACGDWMYPTKGYAFIVCPRTRTEKKGRVSSWSSVAEASERSLDTLRLVRTRYGAWMNEGDPIYVGFSQGAEMAVLAADTGAVAWSGLFVHEGGYRQAKTSLAHLLAGPNAVYATCSTWGCAASLPTKRGARARTADHGPHGHSVGGVARELRVDFAELIRGRDDWAGFYAFREP